jgi:hypothetical protein
MLSVCLSVYVFLCPSIQLYTKLADFYILTHMTPARQRLGKDVPEVTLSTTEGRLKAGTVK